MWLEAALLSPKTRPHRGKERKVTSTATVCKNKDCRHSMTRRGKRLLSSRTPSGNSFRQSSRPRLMWSFAICPIVPPAFFLRRRGSIFSEGRHKMERLPTASLGLILTLCSGLNLSKRGSFPKPENKRHWHCIWKMTRITLCCMEVPTTKIMKFTPRSTFTKLKPNSGFHVTTSPVAFFNRGFLRQFVLMTTKSMFLGVTILMSTSKKDTLMTCMKFNSIFHSKKEGLMQSHLWKELISLTVPSMMALKNLWEGAVLKWWSTSLILITQAWWHHQKEIQ